MDKKLDFGFLLHDDTLEARVPEGYYHIGPCKKGFSVWFLNNDLGQYETIYDALDRANLHYEFARFCPICSSLLGYSPGGIVAIYECPKEHYQETVYHYGMDVRVGTEVFGIDECGYSKDESAKMNAAIAAMKNTNG